MIKKVITIKGVGRYKNFNANDMKINTLLDKLNVIYANNGSGKTTLTAIFKSLQTGNTKIISDRKTIGYDGEQEISILGDFRHDFKGDKWNSTLDNLEIFDTFFINDNVFSGFEVSLDQKKKLHQFVIGEKGVQLAEDLKSTKEDIINAKTAKKDLELEISKSIKEFTVNDFIRIQPDDCINQKIDTKYEEIEIAKRNKEIERMKKFIKIPIIKLPIDIQECKELISTNMESIDAKYIDKVQSHLHLLEESRLNNPQEWIREGFSSILHGDKNCPFCSQDLSNVENLITSYRQFFNEEYNNFKNSCTSTLERAKKYNIQLELEKTKTILSKNKELFDFWSPFVQSEAATALSLDIETNLNELYIQAQGELQKKAANPLNDVNIEKFKILEKELSSLNSFIEDINTQLEPINNEIDFLKRSNKDLKSLEDELKKLQEKSKRFKEPFLSYCNEYIKGDKKINALNKTNKQIQKQLNDYSTETFQKYGTSINQYLKEFSTQFEIRDIKSSIIGRSKDPSVNYILTLNGEEISFENSEGKIKAAKALSDGDRSTLALAFFLAKLDIEENLEDKIVIFDDPLSSLDSNRRNKTVNILLEKSLQAKQTIILSHNESFVFKIYEKASPKMLEVTFNGKLDDLDQNDMEGLMEHRYFTQIKKIESFCEDPDLKESIKELQGSIRIVLEDSIKFRYTKYLKKQYIDHGGKAIGPLSNKEGLGKMINILEASDCVFKDDRTAVIAELRELNEFSMAPHHGNIESAHREERLTISELITFLQQTIDLIYNKL
ncbi:AAA family ATPase [[Bacillus] enclensis]|uniref:AAA family ATPase n=1 Tax=[Bacillus] enclensis TaxID=1402860 RepID=UPI0018DD9F97|nr:AAA family ATPase [[Bacillus] enclensis]MBH9968635.1 AAA family ATPase [[Bacillus] enclensis]